MAQQVTRDERSLGELFSDLATETSNLVKQEVSLAQAELTEKAVTVGKDVGFLVVGGAIGYAALLALIAALIIGLSYFIPAWIAALVVGLIISVVAFLLVTSALNSLKKTTLTPRQTVETLKEDAKWLKDQVS